MPYNCFQIELIIKNHHKTKKLKRTASSNNFIFSVLCECGDLNIGQTQGPIEFRIKEQEIVGIIHESTKLHLTRTAWIEYKRCGKG